MLAASNFCFMSLFIIHFNIKTFKLHLFILLHLYLYLFIKTSFAWVTKLSVNTVFQFGPGVKHNTSK